MADKESWFDLKVVGERAKPFGCCYEGRRFKDILNRLPVLIKQSNSVKFQNANIPFLVLFCYAQPTVWNLFRCSISFCHFLNVDKLLEFSQHKLFQWEDFLLCIPDFIGRYIIILFSLFWELLLPWDNKKTGPMSLSIEYPIMEFLSSWKKGIFSTQAVNC